MGDEATSRVLIVADDLTGSLDTAGAFAEQGLTTVVVAQPLDCDEDAISEARVVSINTDSRHLAGDAAADRVERCVRRFSPSRFNIIFKKIDSTMRGNVVAETMALMGVCSRKRALIAPAFPAQGRTVKNGIVHVDGVPLAQTGFARDALSKPPLKPLGELFSEWVGTEHVRTWRHDEPLQFPDNGVVVADAGSGEEMAEVYSKVSAHTTQTLLVGSAGLGLNLARNLGTAPATAYPRNSKVTGFLEAISIEPIVFVVGSRAARSRQQVEQLRAQPDTVVLEAPNGMLASIPSLRAARQIVVLAVSDPISGDKDSADVARQLARAGLGIASEVCAGAMVVTGGDTAIAVLEASKNPAIQVGGNLMPGIPYARFKHEGRTIVVVTKAGGFGSRDTMADIVRLLRHGTEPGARLGTTPN